jgi:hypothetical protein
MSSLQLASGDGGGVLPIVIRKTSRVVTAQDVDELVPSLAEQRAQRRRLRSLAPDKRSSLGLRGAA